MKNSFLHSWNIHSLVTRHYQMMENYNLGQNKAARQLFCSSLLFCFQEFNCFLQISVWDPRKILQVSWNLKLDSRFLENRNSKLEARNSILDSQKLWGSRIEFRVETVNLHLNGTVVGWNAWRLKFLMNKMVWFATVLGENLLQSN